jgi:transcriptional regulator with XRE-family HTH domain
MSQNRSAFGAFLRARRDRMTPAQAGITPLPGPRRVPGLRREEVALLAALSTDHYSRLEQGRQAAVSEAVLRALTRALRLDETEAAHLRNLAAPGGRARRPAATVQRADPGLLRVATVLDHVPVLLLGRRGEVLARNGLLQAVLGHPLPPGSSFTDYLFLDPGARERIVNWADFAAAAVERLRQSDPDVARWWGDHTVRDYASVRKRIAHRAGGLLDFNIEVVTAPHAPDQHLVIYTVEPDSPTAQALPFLASWAAAEAP